MSNLTFNFDKLYAETNRKIHFSYNQTAIGCDSCNVILDPVTKRDNLNPDVKLGWWIEVFTALPACIYYFGAFENCELAEAAMPAFINDLINKGARGVIARVDFHRPIDLTNNRLNQQDLNQNELSERSPHFPPGIYML